jgi:hypothetical protein
VSAGASKRPAPRRPDVDRRVARIWVTATLLALLVLVVVVNLV